MAPPELALVPESGAYVFAAIAWPDGLEPLPACIVNVE